MKVLIIGRTEALFSTAQHLANQTSHEIAAIITAKAMPEYKKREDDFRRIADTHGAAFHQSQTVDDTVTRLVADTKPDVAVSVNWVSILGKAFIGLFPHGVLNAHYGDLPRYRGNAVTNWAILRGETEIVVTVHRMVPGELDSGDILRQARMPLGENTTIDDVNRFAQSNVPLMFADVLDGLEAGSLVGKPQPETGLKPFRCHPRLPRDGRIDWAQPAKAIHALVRSITTPYSGAFTYYRDAHDRLRKLVVWQSRLVAETTDDVGVPGHVVSNATETGESWVLCGKGILALTSCSHGDEVPFAPGTVWQTTRMRLGMDVEEELFRLVQQSERGT